MTTSNRKIDLSEDNDKKNHLIAEISFLMLELIREINDTEEIVIPIKDWNEFNFVVKQGDSEDHVLVGKCSVAPAEEDIDENEEDFITTTYGDRLH